MPRPKNNILHNLYDKSKTSKAVICHRGKCAGKVLLPHSGNLERHLKAVHAETYAIYIRQKKISYKSKQSCKNVKPKVQNNIPSVPNAPNTEASSTKRNIELAIVDGFTKCNWPLAMIEDRAFQILIQPAFDRDISRINQDVITERILKFSKKTKADIMGDLQGRLVSLKIDAVAAADLILLGIHVQYIKKKNVFIKTLAVRELERNHSSKHLKSLIFDVFNEYSIDVSQILTITTDNGANILKPKNDLSFRNFVEDENSETDDSDCIAHILENINGIFNSYKTINIPSVSQTFQLCANEVQESAGIKEKIEQCRYVAKQLHSSSDILKDDIMDLSTNWSSTFNMLQSLYEIKDDIDELGVENSELTIDSDLWSFIAEFVHCFKPLHEAALKLQTEQHQLCFGELFVSMMAVLFQIENIPPNELTTLLIDAINRRKAELLEINLFNAAVFLDPRIKILLGLDKMIKAKKYIISLHERNVALKDKSILGLLEHEELIIKDEPATSNDILQTPRTLSEFLDNLEKSSMATNDASSSTQTHLDKNLAIHDLQTRLPLDACILDFWYRQSNTLSTVAEIVLAIPSTQASVERLFTALEYVLADRENRLNAFHLEHILLVKLNGVFNYEE